MTRSTGPGGLSGWSVASRRRRRQVRRARRGERLELLELRAPQVLGDLVGIAELVGQLDEQVTGVLRLVGLQVEALELTDQLVHLLTVLVRDLLADLQG